jgi:hypothetical protein
MSPRQGGAFVISVALHGALLLWLIGPFWITAPRSTARPMQVVLLPPVEDSRFPGVNPIDRNTTRWKVDAIDQDDRLADADLAHIVHHIEVLFPFVTPGLAIETFFPSQGGPTRLVFENPYRAKAGQPSVANGPLDLSPDALRQLVDRSWSRGRRWESFQMIREYLDAHDPADDRLALLARLYRDQNALQPYADGAIRDLRVWAQVGLAADHVLFIGYIRQFAARHPHTKVTTELLFLLDTITQANEDALATLVETDQPEDLRWTRQANPRAYILMRRIEQEYARELARRGLVTRAAISAYYDHVRLEILSGILRTTPDGYRANDARFLIGAIHWQQNRRREALEAWRALKLAAGDDTHAPAIAQIREALRPAVPDGRNIDLILKNQQGRWLAFSDDRLRRFGYRFDTY